MSRRIVVPFLTVLTLLFFYIVSYIFLQQAHNRAELSPRSSSGIWNLPPMALLAVAGEFKGLMADYLTLEAGAQLGTQLARTADGGYKVVEKTYDWPNIHRLFVASQTLDPSFAQNYIVMQGWLPWEPANMVEEAQDFLKTTVKNRPWDWQPLHTMGFNAYYFLNSPGEAGKLFLEAAKIPDAPHFLSILGARLAQEGGETEAAIVLVKSMLADKNSEEPGYNDIVDRLQALEGVRIIELAVKNFETSWTRKPLSLEELTSSGILENLPYNPYNTEYCMDASGSIYFDKPDCNNVGSGKKNK